MNIETDKTKIAANIKSINTKRRSLVTLIQATAVACAFHAHKHGDVTLLNNLCDAVGAGMKSTALKLWALDFAPIQLATDKSGGVFAHDKAKSLRDNEPELTKTMALAAAAPWQDYTPDPPVEAFFNVEQALNAIFKKLDKKAPRPEDAPLVAKLKVLAGTAVGEE